MAQSDVATFKTEGKQDDIALAQLGAAVILAWTDLDADLQRDLLNTAENISGIQRALKLREVVDRLVRAHDTHRQK